MREYRLGIYEKSMPGDWTLEQKLRCAKGAGFDYMELSVDETDEKLARLDWSAAERAHVLKLTREVLPIDSICLSAHRKYPLGSPDEPTRARALAIMQGAIRLARDLGIRLIQLAGYDVYYEEGSERTRALFIDGLHQCAEFAAAAGVLLGFETMETPFMDTAGKAMAFVRGVNSAYLGVYPDIGNLTNAAILYGGDVLSDLDNTHGHLLAIHLKETLPGQYREVPFGQGHVDFRAAIARALGLGARMFVAECWYDGSPEPRQTLAKANQFMRAFF